MSTPPITQQPQVVPMCETTRTATITFQWLLERPEDAQTPPFNFNNLNLYICGEEAFARIAEDIKAAEHSVDIVCWGFDPAMELTRREGIWPRGDTWGQLLSDAAGGKNVHSKKVQVRVLSWYDLVGSASVGNLPGFEKNPSVHSFQQIAVPFFGAQEALSELPLDLRRRRETFNRQWFRSALLGQVEGLWFRTRGGDPANSAASLRAQAEAARPASVARLGKLEAFGLEYLATHHQKTIVIDYEGSRPRAYVMGLNSVTAYWDTTAHLFNDPRRGQGFEGEATDHSMGKGWASSDAPTLKPYQDYACRIEGEAVAAVCKNFDQAWNAAERGGKGSGSQVSRSIDLKNPPAHLTQHVKPPYQRAQIVRTLPAADGGERTIERIYYQASSFARHYLYIENQYFQNADWAHALKEQRRCYVEGIAAATPPVPMASVPKLHLIVVMPTPERDQMVPRTHDAMTELGHGDSVPNQDKVLNDELERHARYEQALAEDTEKREAFDAMSRANGSDAVYPVPRPTPPPALSPLAKSYRDAGGTRDSQAARDQLVSTLGLRTLFASLWSWDPDWSIDRSSAVQKAEAEQQRYIDARQEWERYQAARREAKARDIAAGGWGSSIDTRQPPQVPPDRTQQIKDATAQRYREIYIHSKLMIIDDSMFTLGSANLNRRSFAVDSEINIASDSAGTAKALRQRVWAQHTEGQFDGGDATDQIVMAETFANWEQEGADNSQRKLKGQPLSSFLVAFLDERTATYRLG